MITPEELDYIRTAAIGDMLGDSRAFDGMGPSAVIFVRVACGTESPTLIVMGTSFG